MKRRLGLCLFLLAAFGCSQLTEPSSERPVLQVSLPPAPAPAPTTKAQPTVEVVPAAATGRRSRGPVMGAPVDENHVHAAQILIGHDETLVKANPRSKAEAEKLAGEIAARAKKGEDFGALVQRYSDHKSSKPSNGDLGTFAREDFPQSFTDLAFQLKPGQIGGPVETGFGFHVVKRLE